MNPNEHMEYFMPFLEACQPCVMRYHFYMSPQSHYRDIESISNIRQNNMSHLLGPLLEHDIAMDVPQLLTTYYSQLPRSLMTVLRSKLKYELEFYNTLYSVDTSEHAFEL